MPVLSAQSHFCYLYDGSAPGLPCSTKAAVNWFVSKAKGTNLEQQLSGIHFSPLPLHAIQSEKTWGILQSACFGPSNMSSQAGYTFSPSPYDLFLAYFVGVCTTDS